MGSRPKKRRAWDDLGVSLRGSPIAPRSAGGGLLDTADRFLRTESRRRGGSFTDTGDGFVIEATGVAPGEAIERTIDTGQRVHACTAMWTITGGEGTSFGVAIGGNWGTVEVEPDPAQNVERVPFHIPPYSPLTLGFVFQGTGTADLYVVGYST